MNHLFKFFFGGKKTEEYELSPPISIRVPLNLLKQIEDQSEEIGGSRYRSRHFINLLEIGANYFSARTDLLKALPKDVFELHKRIGYVFYELELNPSVVAEEWGHPNVNQWNKWISGEETPSFEVLERFASKYYVNTDWLKYGLDNEYAMYQVHQLPEKCYEDFYEFAKYIFNLGSEKTRELRIVRNKHNGQLLIDVGYGDKQSITVNCGRLYFLNEDSIGSTGLYYLKEFILFMALFQHNKNYPYTYSISDKYFQSIKSGETTFKRTRFLAEDAPEFISSEQWAHVLVDEPLIRTMDVSRVWEGGKSLLIKIFDHSKKLSEKIQAIEDRMNKADVAVIYFKESIELFRNFNEDFYSKKQSVIALMKPTYMSTHENYLISGGSGSGFNHFAHKFIEHKIKENDGLVYINGTGVEKELNLIQNLAKQSGRSEDIYDVNAEGVEELHNAIQNQKIIYFAVKNPHLHNEAKKQLGDFIQELKTNLSEPFYVTEGRTLSIFANECVELFDEGIGRLCEGVGKSLSTNWVNSDRINVQAKLDDPEYTNNVVYEMLLGNTQNRVIYKPNSTSEAALIGKNMDTIDEDNLLNLEKDIFVLRKYNRAEFIHLDNAVFITPIRA